MPDDQFHDDVLKVTTRTETKIDLLTLRVEKINGSIGTLYDLDRAHAKALSEHQQNCSGLVEIKEMNRKLQAGEYPGSQQVRTELLAAEQAEIARNAKEQVSDTWKRALLYPIIKIFVGGGILLFLIHAAEILVKGPVGK